MVERLEADHRVVEDHQDAVDVLGRRWLRQGRLPLAQRLLTPAAELGAIGHEMVARRKEALMERNAHVKQVWCTLQSPAVRCALQPVSVTGTSLA